jgi:hypothetical protein
MNEASRCGFYPGPDEHHPVQQDRLWKCSLTTVEPAQADVQRNTTDALKLSH